MARAMLMFLPLARMFDFDGRSRRAEFWLFALFQLIVMLLFWAIFLGLYGHRLWELAADYLGSGVGGDDYGYGYRPQRFGFDPRYVLSDLGVVLGPGGIGLLIGLQLFGLVMLLPNLAVGIRRLHDSDRSGWWLFAPLLPYLLAAMFVILTFATGFHTGSWMTAAAAGFVLVGLALALTVFAFLIVSGTPGPNRFGADPKRLGRQHSFR